VVQTLGTVPHHTLNPDFDVIKIRDNYRSATAHAEILSRHGAAAEHTAWRRIEP